MRTRTRAVCLARASKAWVRQAAAKGARMLLQACVHEGGLAGPLQPRTAPGILSLVTTPPVATRMCLALRRRVPPAASATSTVCASTRLPRPSAIHRLIDTSMSMARSFTCH